MSTAPYQSLFLPSRCKKLHKARKRIADPSLDPPYTTSQPFDISTKLTGVKGSDAKSMSKYTEEANMTVVESLKTLNRAMWQGSSQGG